MKRLTLFTLTAIALLAGSTAIADEAQPQVLFFEAPNCEAPAMTPADVALPDSAPAGEDLFLPEAQPLQGSTQGCCQGAFRSCQANCAPAGVFEFNCDPDTCQSSCICNIS
jgi:hypothetical protein